MRSRTVRTGRLLLAACLFGVSLAPIGSPASADGTDASLVVQTLSPTGVPLPRVGGTFTASEIDGWHADDVLSQNYQDAGHHDLGPRTGISLGAFVERLGLLRTAVASVTFTCTGVLGTGVLAADDLADPPEAFEGGLPPVIAPTIGPQNNLNFTVEVRKPDHQNPALADGTDCFANPSQPPISIVLKLANLPLTPGIEVRNASVGSGQAVAFSADVDDPDHATGYTWAWVFGDGSSRATDERSTTHVYPRSTQPATYVAHVEVLSSNGASGRSTDVTISVAGSAPTSPPTTPPPGAGHGTGGSSAPANGPATGTGPRVGGVPTNRPGNGQAGPSFASEPPVASVTAAATGDAPRLDGQVVGYLLGDAAAVARQQNPQAARKALDDSAPAARDGRPVTHLLGWLTATVCLAALLLLGAGSERRRPSRRPKRS